MRHARVLLLLLVLNIAASMAHYADNIVRFALYPEPPWLNPSRVDLFWFVMTPVGIVAYVLHRRGWPKAARFASVAYGSMGLLVLGHYLIAPPWKIAFEINALIVLEAVGAAAWLAYTTLPPANFHRVVPASSNGSPPANSETRARGIEYDAV